jgi:hypothetical protein
MEVQKSDYMTLEERGTWSNKTASYAPEAEAKAIAALEERWTTRAPAVKWRTGEPPEGVAVLYEYYEYHRRYAQVGRGGDIQADVSRYIPLAELLPKE